jgi:hypothetical protein
VYGTTYTGGLYNSSSQELGGVAFKLSPAGSGWTETILWNFGRPGDASYPLSGLTPDASGNYYGTSQVGGSAGYGSVFELSPPSTGGASWTESLLYSFPGAGSESGEYPQGSLLIDSHGNLFGAASGTPAVCCSAVFELSPPSSGTAWTLKTLYTFTLKTSAYGPIGLAMDSTAQNIFGVTRYGQIDGRSGPVAFELSQPTVGGGAWTYSSLNTFDGGGLGPQPPLVNASGDVYGAVDGGNSTSENLGTFYEITP